MTAGLRLVAFVVMAAMACVAAPSVRAQPDAARAEEVVRTWYRLVLELTRHTPTYSPPVASRAYAYVGVTAFEALAGGSQTLVSLAGQLNGLSPPPPREPGRDYDDAVVLQAALAAVVRELFANTGPTGQRAMAAVERKLGETAAQGVPDELTARSAAHGRAVATHVLEWSADDGGAVVENMGFPLRGRAADAPGDWVPTSLIAQQQAPLLPRWGENRSFALPDGAACDLPAPPAYSEEATSEFHRQALEVVAVKAGLSPDQRAVARFWADDPMLSPTPPGHWISIGLQVLDDEDAPLDQRVDVLARLGVALADAFVACWRTKFQHDLLRPVTYIRRAIDPAWEPLLNTPPFPEYPSGHSAQSAAAAAVLTDAFGEDFAFEDATHAADGLPPRAFPSFRAAAEEAGESRLYGGIHFRAAIERGRDQGDCVGAFAVALRTRR